MHFFDAENVQRDVHRKCDTIICLGGKDLPFDTIERVKNINTSVVQVDLEGRNDVLEDGRKFKTENLIDVSRMDLLPIESTIPYAVPEDLHVFFCRELGIKDFGIERRSDQIAHKIAGLLGIKIASFKDQTRRFKIEDKIPHTDDCGVLMPWARGPF